MDATIEIVSNTRARLVSDYDEVHVLADEKLSIENKNAWRSRLFKMKRWDGKTHLFSKNTGTFPRGLVSRLSRDFEEHGEIDLKIEDKRGFEPIVPKGTAGMLPRGLLHARKGDDPGRVHADRIVMEQHQVSATLAALSAECGIVASATGTGKTEIACAVMAMLRRTHGKINILFFTHRVQLAKDTRERIAARLGVALEEIGFIGQGQWHEGSSGVYVAILDTLRLKKHYKRRRKLFDSVDALIIDEAHHAASTSWYSLIMSCDARIRIGLSATPLERADAKDMRLVGATGDVLFNFTIKNAIQKGVIADIKIDFVPVRRTEDPVDELDSPLEAKRKAITANPIFHDLVARRVAKQTKKGKRVLVLLHEKAHGRAQLAALDAAGVRAEFVHSVGQHKRLSKDQAEIMQKFRKGIIPCIVATTVLGEGSDIPAVDRVHLCHDFKAVIPVIQGIGRGVRKQKGIKKVCRVSDYAHVTHPKLAEHAVERLAVYRRFGLYP